MWCGALAGGVEWPREVVEWSREVMEWSRVVWCSSHATRHSNTPLCAKSWQHVDPCIPTQIPGAPAVLDPSIPLLHPGQDRAVWDAVGRHVRCAFRQHARPLLPMPSLLRVGGAMGCVTRAATRHMRCHTSHALPHVTRASHALPHAILLARGAPPTKPCPILT